MEMVPRTLPRLVLLTLSLVSVLFNQGVAQTGTVHRKFEYKHSFRAPNLAQRDGSIPFWIVSGDAIASSEQLRLVPSMRSRKGIAWNKRAMVESDNFEVDVALKITGQGRIGADGMAIWYTSLQGTQGPVYGANDYWIGMGLMLDSFDNDGQKNNPFISLMINDGTRSYDHQTDGAQQILSGCQKDFRNKPFPVRVKIEYLKNVLTVSVSDGMQQQPRYELCIRAENIFLPKSGYFGISAATGGLADDHDVLDFSVYSLFTDAQRPAAAQQIPQDERQKYDAEFEKQMAEFEAERKKYKEQHPERAQDDDDDDERSKYFEDTTTRELRLIYESQNAIHKVMQAMDVRLEEISQQQRAHTALLHQGGGAAVAHQQQQQPGGQPPVAAAGGFLQHEKTEVVQSLRDLTVSLRDMKNYVNEIFTRTYNMEQKLGTGGAAGGGAIQQDPNLKNQLEGIQNEVRQIRANQMGGGAGAGCPTCLGSTFFIAIIAVQSAVILGFVFIRSKSDKAKFY